MTTRLVVLDSSPLWLLSGVSGSPEPERCRAWLRGIVAAGFEVAVPEVADYEVRREQLRRDNVAIVDNLDRLCEAHRYLAITTDAMRLAAMLWADLRKVGLPTADDARLDADVILAAQAQLAGLDYDELFVATKNPRHIGRFARINALPWELIG